MKAKSRSQSVLISAETSTIAPSAATPTKKSCRTVRIEAEAAIRSRKAASSAVRKAAAAVPHAPASLNKTISDATGIELDWTGATVTVVSDGGAITGRNGGRRWAQRTFHDRPGNRGLRRRGLSGAVAPGGVTANLAAVIAAIGVGLIKLEVGGIADAG